MRAFLEIARFELRFQLRSPLFLALAAITAFIHFCAARKWGIDIGFGPGADAASLPLNSLISITQTELLLSLFYIFTGVAVLATAITRDHERRTAELFYTQPIKPGAYVAGRFAAGLALAIAIAVAGWLGNFASFQVPGIDPDRIGPASATAWWFTLVAIVIPNTVIVSALVFAAAASARSMAAAFGAALLLPLAPMIAVAQFQRGGADWLALIDPFGLVAIMHETRYWTREEIVSRVPGGVLWTDRWVWLGIAAAVLGVAIARYRFRLGAPRARRKQARQAPVRAAFRSVQAGPAAVPAFGLLPAAAQFASQLRRDLGAILRSPPFYLVVATVVLSCVSQFYTPSVIFNAAYRPLTSRFVEFLDVGLVMQAILSVAWYAGVLVHRERQFRVADIADATPAATAIRVLAKVGALLAMVTLLLLAAVATFVLLQLASGHREVEPGLYLQGLVRYGFNHYLLVVPAVLFHLLFANRWLGMLVFLASIALVLSLPPMGFESLLNTYRLPAAPYSDMNGFGHFAARDLSMMAYWSAFLAVLLLAACVIAPRGHHEDMRGRLADARARLTAPGLALAGAAGLVFAGLGGWIYYNTHVLNDYVTLAMLHDRAAEYERRYRQYEALWTPRAAEVDLALDFFPSERRLESRGTLHFVNDSDKPITELLVTLNPAVQGIGLSLDGATLVERNDALGVRRYRFTPALAPGGSGEARWRFSWRNEGFSNSLPAHALATNGSYVQASQVMPVFGYDRSRELGPALDRRRHGLPPPRRMASLDDPGARGDLSNRVLVPADYRIVLSTSADQLPVGPGRLERRWSGNGRRFARLEGRLPALLAFASARYSVERQQAADGAAVELYFDRKHAAAVPAAMNTATRGLAYFSAQFGPYPAFADTFRIIEYPAYWQSVEWLAGAMAYNETAGFALRFGDGEIDMALAHELAHMWWGVQVQSAALQGEEVLSEALASYSAYMLIEEVQGRRAVRSYLDFTRELYLDAVSREAIEPLPVVRGESALNTYHKGSLALYSLRDAIGAEAVNGALRRFLASYGNCMPPDPTTRELVAELRRAAGLRYQSLITDLFEKVTLYDLVVRDAVSRKRGTGYEVTVRVEGGKRYVDRSGKESAAPLSAPVDVAVFAADGTTPLYLRKHWLRSGTQTLVVRVPSRPAGVAVDPYAMLIDRRPDDNAVEL